MFSLKYKVQYHTNPDYPLSVETATATLPVVSEQYANDFLELVALRGTILEVELLEVR